MGIYNLGGGGGAPVLEARTVTPSTSQQIIKPSRDEYDGLSQVTVEATPLETRTVNPSTSSQTVTPSGSNIGFSTITVNPMRLQSKSVTPTIVPYSVSPDSGYNGLSSVGFGKDANLIADNIVKGKTIYGVSGSAAYPMLVIAEIKNTAVGTSITIPLPSTMSNMSRITSMTVYCNPGLPYQSRNDILTQCIFMFPVSSGYLGIEKSSLTRVTGTVVYGQSVGTLQRMDIAIYDGKIEISSIIVNEPSAPKTLSIGGEHTDVGFIGYSGNPIKV